MLQKLVIKIYNNCRNNIVIVHIGYSYDILGVGVIFMKKS